jgi:hypothetical protein
MNWFGQDAEDYGYFVQAAHYLDGAAQIDKLMGRDPQGRRFMFLVVEGKEHKETGRHRVKIFEYQENQLEDSLMFRDKLLAQWKTLYEQNKHPGQRHLVHPLYLSERAVHSMGNM